MTFASKSIIVTHNDSSIIKNRSKGAVKRYIEGSRAACILVANPFTILLEGRFIVLVDKCVISMSKPFYRFLAFIFLWGLILIQLSAYYDPFQAETDKKNLALQEKLASLEAISAPLKERAKTKAKIGRMLAKFKATLGQEPAAIAELIMDQSDRYDIDPLLILAMIKTESDFRRTVVSRKGAVGLMQLRPFIVPALAKEANITYVSARNLKDGTVNIKLGTHYLAKLIKRFGSLDLALEAYNRGPTRLVRQLNKKQKIRPIYADRVLRNYDRFWSEFTRL